MIVHRVMEVLVIDYVFLFTFLERNGPEPGHCIEGLRLPRSVYSLALMGKRTCMCDQYTYARQYSWHIKIKSSLA